MVEGARLESVFRGNSNVGSNPTLSATVPRSSAQRVLLDILPRDGVDQADDEVDDSENDQASENEERPSGPGALV